MLYGMTYDEFWHGKPNLVIFYRKKHRLEIEQKNQELWLQGLYFNNAVSVALNNAFSKKKSQYIEKPIRLFPETEDEKKAKAEETKRKLVAKLNAWKDAFDKANKANHAGQAVKE